jgi:hypothetical protein
VADNDRFAPMEAGDLIADFLVNRRLRRRWLFVSEKLTKIPIREGSTDSGIQPWHKYEIREALQQIGQLVEVISQRQSRPSPLPQIMLVRELLAFVDDVDRRIDDCVAKGNDVDPTW